MEITPKMQFVEGSFDTRTSLMVSVPSDKHATVDLCIKSENGWNVPIGKVELFDSDRYVDAKATFDDARALGEEIARRWSECTDKR